MKSAAAVLLIAIVMLPVAPAFALTIYTRSDKPQKTDDPAGGNGWAVQPGGVVVVTLANNQNLFVGIENTYVDPLAKSLTVTITGAGADKIKGRGSVGHYTDATGKTRDVPGERTGSSSTTNPDSSTISYLYVTQPDWEWIRFRNTGPAGTFTLTVIAESSCDFPNYDEGFLTIDGRFSTLEGTEEPMDFDEIYWFPVSGALDTDISVSGNFDGTGPWFFLYTTLAPDGSSFANPGAHLTTKGNPGLAPDQPYAVSLPQLVPIADYVVYAHDAVSDAWRRFERDMRPRVRGIGLHADAGLSSRQIPVDTVAGDDFADEGEPETAEGEPPSEDVLAMPTVESRAAGVNTIVIRLDRPVTGDPSGFVVTDANGGVIAGTLNYEAPARLRWTPNDGPLPNGACYAVEYGAAVTSLVGDDEFSFSALIGDVDGDGTVTNDDVTLVEGRFGVATGDDLGVRADIDADGVVDEDDVAIVQSNIGAALACAGPPCPADVDGDGVVGFGDLLSLLSSWGPCGGCPADLNRDGAVGFSDLLQMLSDWGPCP